MGKDRKEGLETNKKCRVQVGHLSKCKTVLFREGVATKSR